MKATASPQTILRPKRPLFDTTPPNLAGGSKSCASLRSEDYNDYIIVRGIPRLRPCRFRIERTRKRTEPYAELEGDTRGYRASFAASDVPLTRGVALHLLRSAKM